MLSGGRCRYVFYICCVKLTLAVYLLVGLFAVSQTGCNKCYECTVQTEFGPVSKDVCGRKRDIKSLISHLENYVDTAGYGPWVCE
ncbi:MAG: hypothetical protein Kow0075_03390 [Salibacteraceae bacterium]